MHSCLHEDAGCRRFSTVKSNAILLILKILRDLSIL